MSCAAAYVHEINIRRGGRIEGRIRPEEDVTSRDWGDLPGQAAHPG